MAGKHVPASRQEQIEELMQQLRPKMEEALQRMVERAVDVPEHEEFGAIEYEFRDAGLNVANEVRQASLASRKKRGT
jgi:maltose-binding protein MalE